MTTLQTTVEEKLDFHRRVSYPPGRKKCPCRLGRRLIAANVLEHLKDGDCIQLGIGGMPNILGKMISETDLKTPKARDSSRSPSPILISGTT
jgi:DeoR/GlpR family transcriptional regulator of sugar metabolism